MSAAVRRRRVWWKRALPRDREARTLMRIRRLGFTYRTLFYRLAGLEGALSPGRVNAETLSALKGLRVNSRSFTI